MERLSDFAADIVNDLYENSDWYGDRSLIEAAINRLAAYKDTGLEPEEVNVIAGLASENCAKVADKIDQLLSDDKELEQYRALGPIDRLRELKQADDEGRCVVLPFKPPRWVYVCSTRFPKPAQAHYASAINVLQDMDKGCVFGDTQEEAAAALRRELE
jgi:hypothetical protein